MGEAAAERAAIADREVGDVADHVAEEFAERSVADRLVERGMPHAGADAKLAIGNFEAFERRDAIDIDKMARLGEPECHGRNQALAAGQHPAILRRHLGEQRDGFVDCFRRVIAERRRLHRADFIRLVSTLGLEYVFGVKHAFWHRVKVRSGGAPA